MSKFIIEGGRKSAVTAETGGGAEQADAGPLTGSGQAKKGGDEYSEPLI